MNQVGANIRQNLIASTLFGPLRSVVPAVLGMCFYPMLLHAGGFELVGIWSILQLLVDYIALYCCGLPSLTMRRVATNVGSREARTEYVKVILGGYLFGGTILLAAMVIFAQPFWRLAQFPADPHVTLILATTILAGIIFNVASIYAAVLSGLHCGYIAQMAETVAAITQFIIAAGFIAFEQASLGLAISLLAGKLTILIVVATVTRRQAPDYFPIGPSLHLRKFAQLLAEARGFILLETGHALLGPIVRGLLVVMAGPAEVGLFDIANRLPALIRSSFSYGLMAIFPAITALHAQRMRAGISQVLRASTGVVVLLIVAPLAAYMTLAKPILSLWLGAAGVQVSAIASVTAAWWIVTAYNIPFYITIQALGLENLAARNVWLHIFLIVLGSAGFQWVDISAMTVSWLVLITGVIAQVQFYIDVQSRAQLLTLAFANPRERIAIAASLVLVASAVWLRIDATGAAFFTAQAFRSLVVFLLIWAAILGFFTAGRPLRFLSSILRRAPTSDSGI